MRGRTPLQPRPTLRHVRANSLRGGGAVMSAIITGGTATYCNTLQHTATHCNTLQHTATHCITLQYTATHCNAHCDVVNQKEQNSLVYPQKSPIYSQKNPIHSQKNPIHWT